MKLTKAFIASLGPSVKSQEIYWDDLLPNLGVRVYPGGQTSWVLRYRIKKRRRLKVIGPTYLLTLDEARKRAKEMLLNVLDEVDPAPKGKYISFRRFSKLFMERHSKPKKTSWKEDEGRLRLYLVPAWGDRLVSSISRMDVVELHFDISVNKKYPITANRVLEQAQTMFKYAILWGFRDEKDGNPGWGVDPNPEISRDRWVSKSEMPILAQAINRHPSLHVRVAIWCYLLTAVRKMELLGIRWSDIDFEKKQVRIRNHKTIKKTGKPKYVELCNTVIELLELLPRNSVYVFPGQYGKGHRKNVDGAWRQIRAWAGLESDDPYQNLQLHDLRRTVGAWLAESNFSMKIIGGVLHQTSERATQVYAHIADDTKRRAIEHHEAEMKPFMGMIKTGDLS